MEQTIIIYAMDQFKIQQITLYQNTDGRDTPARPGDGSGKH